MKVILWACVGDQPPAQLAQFTLHSLATSNMEIVAMLRALADAWEAQGGPAELTVANVVG